MNKELEEPREKDSPMRFGFHPLTDLNSPQRMLDETVLAVQFGFHEIYFADHFHPWSVAEGTSFAWTLIASAAERTNGTRIGTAVTCAMFRYNPAIVAQAFATLGATYEGRIFLGIGTGEALNEVPVGCSWPKGRERLQRLEESIEIIRKLWGGDYVTYNGKYYTLKQAKLFTIPSKKIPLYISGFGPKAASLAGRLGDAWITGNLPEQYIKTTLIPSFEKGSEERQDNKQPEKIAEVILSYDEDIEKATKSLRPFAGTISPQFSLDLTDPREIQALGDDVDDKTLAERFRPTNNVDQIISLMDKFAKLEFDCVEIASLSPNNRRFMEIFREKVVPHFSS